MSIPASRAAASTASRSSTTRPKWRVASGPCVRPSASARNWSPMSTNAMPGDPAAQLQLEQAPVEVERLVDRADLERDVVDPDGAGHALQANGARSRRRGRRGSAAPSARSAASRAGGGESRTRGRRARATGLVAVTVAFRGRCETSAISPKKAPAPRLLSSRPLALTSTSPSTRRKNSWPCRPSSISFVPAGRLSSSASVEISPSSFLLQPANSGTCPQQFELRVLAHPHGPILTSVVEAAKG